MKNIKLSRGGEYTAPAMEVCLVVAERGFEASMPGVTINPWEREEDTLEF